MMTKTMRMPLTMLIAAMLALVLGTGCTPLVRERTLPASIRSVYVPMILNRTQEPGIEERLTVALQQEIMADGRLHVTSRKHADAIVEVVINSFSEYPFTTDENDFGVIKLWNLKAQISIFENIPGKPIIGKPRTLNIDHGFNDDPRTTTFDPQPRVVELLADQFAKMAILEILTGEFADNPEEQVFRNEPTGGKQPSFVIGQ